MILLTVFGKHGVGGFLYDRFNFNIIFTWRAVLLALSVMSVPLLVRSARVAFEEVNPRLEQIARTLGAGGWRVFFTITVPLAARGIVGGMLLAFARALGEFGATIMVAGYLPGKTATISLAIYENVQIGEDAHAYRLLAVSVVLAFIAVWCSEFFLRRKKADMSLLLKNILLPLADFTLEVDVEMHGRVTAIFGPSGAGKTSLLDLIAGLRVARSAFIQLGGSVLTDTAKKFSMATHRRGIGYVPQDLALFPHLSVRQNLLYGRNPHAAGPLFSFEHVMKVLEIESLISRGVTELSGGEKQRVALARALLASPRLLLLDEPLASLDVPLKEKIIPYLGRVRDEFQIPMLCVTHDRFVALTLADEIVVLMNGKVMQTGPVADVFNRPANAEVARFAGVETLQPGRITSVNEGLATVSVDRVTLTALAPATPAQRSVCLHSRRGRGAPT